MTIGPSVLVGGSFSPLVDRVALLGILRGPANMALRRKPTPVPAPGN